MQTAKVPAPKKAPLWLLHCMRLIDASGLPGSTRLGNLLALNCFSSEGVEVALPNVGSLIINMASPTTRGLVFRSLEGHDWEGEHATLMRMFLNKGNIAWDFGANLGLHTVRLAHAVGSSGKVIAVEPNPLLASLLRATAVSLPQIEVLECAMTSNDGVGTLTIPEDHELASVTFEPGTGGKRVECQLRQASRMIADGSLPLPDLVKMDVEGSELEVLEDLRASVFDIANAPVLLIEANDSAAQRVGKRATDIIDFLRKCPTADYTIFVEHNHVRWIRDRVPDPLNQYLLAVPRARFFSHSSFANATELKVTNARVVPIS